MKTVVLSLLLILGFQTAMAGDSGCGLGSVIIQKKLKRFAAFIDDDKFILLYSTIGNHFRNFGLLLQWACDDR